MGNYDKLDTQIQREIEAQEEDYKIEVAERQELDDLIDKILERLVERLQY